MTASLITKKIIANALKKIMAKESIHRVSVSDIMRECKMRRQTFYYHFQDKFELLEWIYKEETKENITDFIEYEKWENILEQLFEYFYQNQHFYRNALEVTEQNSFNHYLFEHIKTLFLKIVEDFSERNDLSISSQKKDLLASFYSHGFVGLIRQWIEQSCQIEPAVMSGLVKDMVHNQMFLSYPGINGRLGEKNDKNHQSS